MAKNNFFKFEMLVLKTLSTADYYGYDIVKQIYHDSNGMIDLKEGTLYPIMYKLLAANYISSYDKIINRKVRVYYHIEESGKEHLKQLEKDFTDMVNCINEMLKK